MNEKQNKINSTKTRTCWTKKIRTNFKTKNKNINKEEKKTRDISDIDKNLVKIEFKNRRPITSSTPSSSSSLSLTV